MLALKEDRPLTTEEQRLCESAIKFALSPEGQEKIRNALDKADEFNKHMNELARIDPDILNKPFTI